MNGDDEDDEYDHMQTGQAYGDQRSITGGAAQDVHHAGATCSLPILCNVPYNGYYTLHLRRCNMHNTCEGDAILCHTKLYCPGCARRCNMLNANTLHCTNGHGYITLHASGVRYFAILWTRVQRALSVCTYTGCDVTSPGSTCPALSSSSAPP